MFLPIVCCAFLVGRNRRSWILVGVVLAATVLTVTPWVVRNKVSVGCFTITTDTRALWKANNLNTYDTLAAGKWIDDVPPLPNEPPTPEFAGDYYKVYGKVLPVDECGRMRFYRHLVVQFWENHPGEKAKLAGQAAEMLWNPKALKTEGRSESGGFVDKLRTWAQPAYSIPLFLLALVGVFSAAAARRRGWPSRCSPTRRSWRWASPARRGTGCRGTSCSRSPPRAAIWWAVDRRRRGVRVVHVHRIRGIGGSERHLLTLLPALRERGVEPVFLGLDDPAWAASPSTGARRSSRCGCACPRDLDLGLARRVRARSRGSLRRSSTRTSCTATSTARYGAGGARARLDQAQRRPLPARGVPVRRAGGDAARRRG